MKLRVLLNTFITCLFLSSCAEQSFRNVVEEHRLDSLTNESLTRYDTKRLLKLEANTNEIISSALVACHQEKFVKGMNILKSHLNNYKNETDYWNALGTCYILNSQYSVAFFYLNIGFETLKSKSKKNHLVESSLYNNLGYLHLKLNNYAEAKLAFEKSIELMPSSLAPKFNLAQLYLQFNQDDNALELFKKLENTNNQDIDVLYALSLIYLRKGDENKSFEYISKVNSNYLNRSDIVGLYSYGLLKKNKLTEAKEILEKRTYSQSYNSRNEEILNLVNDKIKVLADSTN